MFRVLDLNEFVPDQPAHLQDGVFVVEGHGGFALTQVDNLVETRLFLLDFAELDAGFQLFFLKLGDASFHVLGGDHAKGQLRQKLCGIFAAFRLLLGEPWKITRARGFHIIFEMDHIVFRRRACILSQRSKFQLKQNHEDQHRYNRLCPTRQP